MKKFRWLNFLILAIISSNIASANHINTMREIIDRVNNVKQNFASTMSRSINLYRQSRNSGPEVLDLYHENQVKVSDLFLQLNEMDTSKKFSKTLLGRMCSEDEDLTDIIKRIMNELKRLLAAAQIPITSYGNDLMHSMKTILDEPTPPMEDLALLYQQLTVTTGDGKEKLKIPLNNIQNEPDNCDLRQSTQRYMVEFYAMILILEHVGISSILLALSITGQLPLTVTEYARSIQNGQRVIPLAISRIEKYLNLFTEFLQNGDQGIHRCDPHNYIKDSTYFELDGYSQLILIDQKAMTTTSAPCTWTSCGEIKLDCKIDPKGCNRISDFVEVHRCAGRIHKCQDLGVRLEACYSLPKSESNVRYTWFGARGTSYGQQNSCDNHVWSGSHAKRDLTTQGTQCQYCSCVCDESSTNALFPHSIDITLKQSDVASNKVIIGVRIARFENIIFLQIKEGTLLPYGAIAADDVDNDWFPSNSTYHQSHPGFGEISTVLYEISEGQDQVVLGDSPLLPSTVMTAIAFRVNQANQIYLYVEGKSFDIETGELDLVADTDVSDSHIVSEKEIPLSDKMSPLSTNEKTTIADDWNSYVKFQHSSATHDAGQTTLPFFDALELESIPPAPFAGLGLGYKAAGKDIGGYITLKGTVLDQIIAMKAIKERLS